MPELTIQTLPLLLAFIVPGFVWRAVHRHIQVSPDEPRDSWLGIFTLSAINYALWFWLVPRLWVQTQAAISVDQPPTVWLIVGWMVITLGSPVLLGFMTGMSHRTRWWRELVRSRLKLSIPHPVGTAWSYVFGGASQSGPLWVTVRLKDDSVIHGYYAARSFASSVSSEPDLFLEQVYTVDASGAPAAVPESAGVWIAGEEIKAMDFRWIQIKDESDV